MLRLEAHYLHDGYLKDHDFYLNVYWKYLQIIRRLKICKMKNLNNRYRFDVKNNFNDNNIVGSYRKCIKNFLTRYYKIDDGETLPNHKHTIIN